MGWCKRAKTRITHTHTQMNVTLNLQKDVGKNGPLNGKAKITILMYSKKCDFTHCCPPMGRLWVGYPLCHRNTHTTSIVAFALYAGPEWLKHPAWHSTTLNTQTEIIVRHFDWWKANHSKRPIRLMTNSDEWMWRSLQLSGPTFLDWNNCPLPVTDSQIYSIIIQSLWYDCFDFVDFILGYRLFNHLHGPNHCLHGEQT